MKLLKKNSASYDGCHGIPIWERELNKKTQRETSHGITLGRSTVVVSLHLRPLNGNEDERGKEFIKCLHSFKDVIRKSDLQNDKHQLLAGW